MKGILNRDGTIVHFSELKTDCLVNEEKKTKKKSIVLEMDCF